MLHNSSYRSVFFPMMIFLAHTYNTAKEKLTKCFHYNSDSLSSHPPTLLSLLWRRENATICVQFSTWSIFYLPNLTSLLTAQIGNNPLKSPFYFSPPPSSSSVWLLALQNTFSFFFGRLTGIKNDAGVGVVGKENP